MVRKNATGCQVRCSMHWHTLQPRESNTRVITMAPRCLNVAALECMLKEKPISAKIKETTLS